MAQNHVTKHKNVYYKKGHIFRRHFLYLNGLLCWQETVENYLHKPRNLFPKKNVDQTKTKEVIAINCNKCPYNFGIYFSVTPAVPVDGPVIIYQVVGRIKHYTDWASYLQIENDDVPKEGEVYKFNDPATKKKEIDVTIIKYFLCVADCRAYQEMKTQEPNGKTKTKAAKKIKTPKTKAAKKPEDAKKTFKRQGKPYTTVRLEESPECTKEYLEYAKASYFAGKRRGL